MRAWLLILLTGCTSEALELPPRDGALWARAFGDEARDQALALAVTPEGDVAIAGAFAGAIDFGLGALEAGAPADLYLARFDERGAPLSQRRIDQSDGDVVLLRAAPAGEAIVLAGRAFGDRLDLGGGPLPLEGADAFLAVYEPDGAHRFSRTFGGAGAQGIQALASENGRIYVAGHFAGALEVDGRRYAAERSSTDLFVAAFEADGNLSWLRTFASGGRVTAGALAVREGVVYVSGLFTGRIELEGGALVGGPDPDPFLLRLQGPEGRAAAGRAFVAPGAQEIGMIAPTADAVFVGGTFQRPIDLGGGPLMTRGRTDFFVGALSPDLSHRWSRRFGDEEVDVLRALVVGPDRLLLAGSFAGGLELGRPGLTSSGGQDIFFCELDPSGEVRWARRFGQGEGDQVVAGIARAGLRVYLLGAFEGEVDAGLGSVASAGDLDVFLVRFR